MTKTANPARLHVRDLLARPAWNVLAAARRPDAISKPTAIVWTAELERTDFSGGEYVASKVELWLIHPNQDGKNLEDDLDKMLTAALDTIETDPAVTWSTATRSSLDGALHGWHIILTVAHHISKE